MRPLTLLNAASWNSEENIHLVVTVSTGHAPDTGLGSEDTVGTMAGRDPVQGAYSLWETQIYHEWHVLTFQGTPALA